MDPRLTETLAGWAEEYNDPKYFQEDPIIFPTEFARRMDSGSARLQDVETSALLASHLAWGRRAMIVRDCNRMFDEMEWRPYDYIMNGEYRDEERSLHRTVKWSEFAAICGRLRDIYTSRQSMEGMTDAEIRVKVFGQKEVWKDSDKKALILPLDVHVYNQAIALGLTARRQKDIVTAREITDAFLEIWPEDPCKGDFALFGYGVNNKG